MITLSWWERGTVELENSLEILTSDFEIFICVGEILVERTEKRNKQRSLKSTQETESRPWIRSWLLGFLVSISIFKKVSSDLVQKLYVKHERVPD